MSDTEKQAKDQLSSNAASSRGGGQSMTLKRKSVSFKGVSEAGVELAEVEEDGDQNVFMGQPNSHRSEEDKAKEKKDEAEVSSEYELVEEGGEDEQEEMVIGDLDQTMEPTLNNEAGAGGKGEKRKKGKRLVRRKKRKTNKALAEPKNADKAVQMPTWTEALEFEYMTQD